jgi:hypothetical protein
MNQHLTRIQADSGLAGAFFFDFTQGPEPVLRLAALGAERVRELCEDRGSIPADESFVFGTCPT